MGANLGHRSVYQLTSWIWYRWEGHKRRFRLKYDHRRGKQLDTLRCLFHSLIIKQRASLLCCIVALLSLLMWRP